MEVLHSEAVTAIGDGSLLSSFTEGLQGTFSIFTVSKKVFFVFKMFRFPFSLEKNMDSILSIHGAFC